MGALWVVICVFSSWYPFLVWGLFWLTPSSHPSSLADSQCLLVSSQCIPSAWGQAEHSCGSQGKSAAVVSRQLTQQHMVSESHFSGGHSWVKSLHTCKNNALSPKSPFPRVLIKLSWISGGRDGSIIKISHCSSRVPNLSSPALTVGGGS